MNTNYRSIISTICLFFALALPVLAAPGDLDPTFGNGGIVNTYSNNLMVGASGMATQPDGKIVAVGSSLAGFAVVRYSTNGSLDSSFGGTGMVFTAIPGFLQSGAAAVAIQKDGKIVAVGRGWNGTEYDFVLVRYNTDGSLDNSFNGMGIVTTDVGSTTGYATSVAIQSDDKIVVGGYCSNGSNYDFALVRYRTEGSLDLSFSGGIVITPIGDSNDFVASVAVQPDRKIVAAGQAGTSFAVVRYTVWGQLDTSFNGAGKVITSFDNANSGATSLALQWDGKIVAAGYNQTGLQNNFALVRYYSNGDLDPSFGGTGKVSIPASNLSGRAQSVAIQSDGKIVAAGETLPNWAFALVRLNSNGSLDSTFNGNGVVVTNAAYGVADSVAIQPDGRILAAGGDWDNGFFVARYFGGPLRINGKIAFTSDRDGDMEIYVMNNDGTGQTRLTNHPGIDSLAAFSPDGRKIAYVSQTNTNSLAASIKIMNADGTNQTVLTPITLNSNSNNWQNIRSLSWSPDGSKIAFDDVGEIFSVNVDGSNRTNLTNHPGGDVAPAWSPDGTRILFSSSRNGRSELHTMETDGENVKVLYSPPYWWDQTPDWSPAGDKVIFVLESEDFGPIIYTADADGTYRQLFGSITGGLKGKPKWSPDSTKIVFHNVQNMDCEIYVKNVHGGGAVQLTNTTGHNFQPTWQPRVIRASSPVAAESDVPM